MIDEVRAWLPKSVATSDVIRTRLEAAVAEWRARWFAAGEIRLSDLAASDQRERSAAEETVHGSIVCLTLTAKMKTRLLQLALDRRLDGLVLGEADREVLAVFAERMLTSLLEHVEQHLEISQVVGEDLRPPPVDPPGIAATLSEGRERLLTLWTPLSAVLPPVKASLPAPRRTATGLIPSSVAIGPKPVTLEARLGVAVVSLEELRDFEAGDVIVLDAPLGNGIALAGANCEIARGAIGHAGDRLSLTLHAPTAVA